MLKDIMNKTNFKKKVYRKLDSSPLWSSISLSRAPREQEPKKIIASKATTNLREEFKKTFLPLLIEVFELRQSIENYKAELQDPLNSSEKDTRSPQEILARLEQLRADFEESQRWCEGVILQIAKGIDEALELMNCDKEEGLLKRILRRLTH